MPNGEAPKPEKAKGPGMRAFISIDVPAEVMAKAREEWRKAGMEGRFRYERASHMTLFFFKSLSAEKVAEVERAMAALSSPAFRVALRGFGAFTPARPRVVYADIASPASLLDLRAELAALLEGSHVRTEKREFQPHLTVCRVKGDASKEEAAAIRAFIDASVGKPFGEFLCTEVKLVRSFPTTSGYAHETIYAKGLS